jgi:hypothetical protein
VNPGSFGFQFIYSPSTLPQSHSGFQKNVQTNLDDVKPPPRKFGENFFLNFLKQIWRKKWKQKCSVLVNN